MFIANRYNPLILSTIQDLYRGNPPCKIKLQLNVYIVHNIFNGKLSIGFARVADWTGFI